MENKLRKFFRGSKCSFDEVDFETSKCLYEVKSCNLFNKCYNGNDRRPYIECRHKKCLTNQLGRFSINPENHIGLYLRSLQTGKVPKYIFALTYQNQSIFRVLEWEDVVIPNTKKHYFVRLADLFGEATPLDKI